MTGSVDRVVSSLVPIFKAASFTEKIARDISLSQASLATNEQLTRALRQQSRQEGQHASAFDTGLIFIGRRGPQPDSLIGTLTRLGQELQRLVDLGHLATSMYGLHCVLEGLGTVALEPNENDLATVGHAFFPLEIRERSHKQEVAHRRLGEVWVPRLLPLASQEERVSFASVRATLNELAEEVIHHGLPLLVDVRSDLDAYRAAAGRFILDLKRQAEAYDKLTETI